VEVKKEMPKKGFGGIIMMFVGITIALVLVANVVMPTIFDANQTGWDAGTIAMWGILGIGMVAVVLLMLFRGK
jgi:hypothetical protein